jgi:hypothetical protein
MSGWSSTRATRKRRTRSWPKERVTTTRSPATPPLLVAFHPPWAVIYLTDKVAREVAECSPTPLSKPDLCYSHHAARWLPRAASTMSRQSTVPRSVNKTSFIRRYLCWRGERPQARRTGPVVSTTASRSVTNVSNESLRPRGQRFARDSPLEGDGFELSVPRQKDNVFEAPQLDSAIPGKRLRIRWQPPEPRNRLCGLYAAGGTLAISVAHTNSNRVRAR